MSILDELKKQGLSAHAYLVRAPRTAFAELNAAIQGGELGSVETADCYSREYEALSVDDARDISTFAYYKPVGERKYIIVAAGSINTEAQNALLKIVEEGSGSSRFFFILEQGVSVLSTLESRCVTIKTQGEENGNKAAKEFLKMDYKERLALAEKFTKDHDREGARALVRSLLSVANSQKFKSETLRDLLQADQYLKLSGSSPKSVISHLALIV